VPVQLAGNTFSGTSEIVDPPSCVAPGGGASPPPPSISPDGSIISGGTGSPQTAVSPPIAVPAARERLAELNRQYLDLPDWYCDIVAGK